MTKKCNGCGKETNLVMGLGPVLLCQAECYPDILMEIEALREAGESVDVTLLVRRRYNRLHDNTVSTPRVNKRNKALNEMARDLGFDGLSNMLTAWLNDEIKITVQRTDEDDAAAQN